VTQRSRIEDLLLLALRCLIIALLALGFARPFLRNSAAVDPLSQPPARILILVDTSASMRRAGLWEMAKARASARVRAAAPADEVALWAFDRQPRPLVSFAEWNASPAGTRSALIDLRLSTLEPGWGSTHLDEALAVAAEAMLENSDRSTPGPRRIVVVSDLQEGSHLGRLQAFEWPKGIEVAVESLKARNPDNAGLQIIADSSATMATTQSVVRLRVFNSPESTSDRFDVGWARPDGDGFLDRAEAVQVSPGQTRIVTIPVPGGAGATQILLRGDGEGFDNRVYLVPFPSTPLRALYVGTEPPDDERQPLFFLRSAFPTSGRLGADIVVQPPDQPLSPEAAKAAGLYFVAERVPSATAHQLRTEVSAGKTLVLVPKTPDVFATLGDLLEIPGLGAEEAGVRSYAMLGNVDFQHPLLAPFADPRFSDFTKIHFWKYRRFDDARLPGARSVARFDSGDPALVEIPVGRGRIFVFASTWRPEDSQLALSTKFVPLLLSLAESGGASGPEPDLSHEVGDVLSLSGIEVAGDGMGMRLPNGETIHLAAGVTNFTETTAPGIYEVVSSQPPRRFAVNLDGAESQTEPLALETLESFGTPVGAVEAHPPLSAGRRQQLAAVEAEGRQKMWRWLIVAALGTLLAESMFAGWQGRRVLPGKETLA
jgi:hypothetical protein